MEYAYRALDDETMPDYLRLNNAVWDWCPLNAKNVQQEIKTWPEGKFQLHQVQYLGESAVGMLQFMEAFWFPTHRTGQFFVGGLAELPEAVDHSILNAEQIGRAQGYEKLITYGPDKHAWLIEAIERAGYKSEMKNQVTCLDLKGIEFEAPKTDLEIVDYLQYRERNPEGFAQEAYQLEQDLLEDVPMPEKYESEPFESWWAHFNREEVKFEYMFLALDGERPVGLSQIRPNSVDPTLALTGLTGVRREYRRRGLATALKLAAMSNAKALGVKSLYTDNEENNPMLQLNYRLGFEPKFNLCSFSKMLV